MVSRKDNSAFQNYLDSVLLLTMAGIIVTIILMSGLYWLGLNVFLKAVGEETTLAVLLLDRLRLYTVLIAGALGISAISVLLSALRNARFLSGPFESLQLFRKNHPQLMGKPSIVKILVVFYKKLRFRMIVFILAGMGTSFILMAALYLFIITFVFLYSSLSPLFLERLFSELAYYGSLIFFTLVLSAFLLLLISLRRLRQILRISSESLSNKTGDLNDLSLEELRQVMDREILVAQVFEKRSDINGE